MFKYFAESRPAFSDTRCLDYASQLLRYLHHCPHHIPSCKAHFHLSLLLLQVIPKITVFEREQRGGYLLDFCLLTFWWWQHLVLRHFHCFVDDQLHFLSHAFTRWCNSPVLDRNAWPAGGCLPVTAATRCVHREKREGGQGQHVLLLPGLAKRFF